MKKILYIQPLHPSGMELLKKKYEIYIADNEDKEYLKSIIGDYHGIVTRLTRIDSELIAAGKRLEVIAKHGVGTDNIDTETAVERGIKIVTTGDANSQSVAEHTIFALGALCKRVVYLDGAMRKGLWQARDESGSVDLSGKKIGVIGMGRIGARVAQIARNGFHAQVYVYDPYMDAGKVEALGYVYADDLDKLCGAVDFLTIHVPLSEKTKNLIDGRRLSLMKRSAFLANFSRGGIVNEADLYEALRERRIAGAAIDAFETEPPPETLPLLELPNVLLSPHCGTFSEDSKKRMSIAVAEGIDAVLGGE